MPDKLLYIIRADGALGDGMIGVHVSAICLNNNGRKYGRANNGRCEGARRTCYGSSCVGD